MYKPINLPFKLLTFCTFCPRNCGANRYSNKLGYCQTDASFSISSICNHKGEEPPVSGKNGICNLFFNRCNLQCIYCQNHQISKNKGQIINNFSDLENITTQINRHLNEGCHAVGFVSPSHCIPQMKAIINELNESGRKPVIVMNTNAYDKQETIRELEDLIDVYLPDFKYMDSGLAFELSGARDYPQVAAQSIKEMYRQKGSTLFTDEKEQAESGLIIRHLVLPGNLNNSIKVLNFVAEEISTSVHISLMSQYYPANETVGHPILGRSLRQDEYSRVVEKAEELGFYKIFTQEMDSTKTYRPDFFANHPFER